MATELFVFALGIPLGLPCNEAKDGNQNGYFVGPTIFAEVKRGMQIYVSRLSRSFHSVVSLVTGPRCSKENEIFGPVLACVEVDSFDQAIRFVNEHLVRCGMRRLRCSKPHGRWAIGTECSGNKTQGQTGSQFASNIMMLPICWVLLLCFVA